MNSATESFVSGDSVDLLELLEAALNYRIQTHMSVAMDQL